LILPVTFTFVALCGIAMFGLVGSIGLLRHRRGVLRADGGHPDLFKRIRIHGNFVETAPLTILASGAAETLGLAALWLWLGFVSYVVGRVLHVIQYDSPRRGIAMFFTTAPALLMGFWVLYRLWLV